MRILRKRKDWNSKWAQKEERTKVEIVSLKRRMKEVMKSKTKKVDYLECNRLRRKEMRITSSREQYVKH